MNPTLAIMLALLLPACASFSRERSALRNAGKISKSLDADLVEALRSATPTFRK